MPVRAKFVVHTKVDNGEGEASIKLYPVSSGSQENKDFYKWTPGGVIELGTINAKAAAEFEEGKEFYVDFTPAPIAEPVAPAAN